MAMTQTQLKAMLNNEIPGGSQNLPGWTNIQVEAIKDAIALAVPVLREYVEQDWIGDGVSTRVPLVGRNVTLAPPDQWITPAGLNDAGLAAPTTAPTATASSGAGLAAGQWSISYALQTGLGITQCTSFTTVTTTGTNGRITFGALSGLDSRVTGVPVYLSRSGYNPSLGLVTTITPANNATTATVISAAPLAGATAPQIDYTDLSSLGAPQGIYDVGFNAENVADTTKTVVQFDTPLSFGAIARIPFYRRPVTPTQDSDTIGLDDDFLRPAVMMSCCRILTLFHQSGDTTKYQQMWTNLFPVVQAILEERAARPNIRINTIDWTE